MAIKKATKAQLENINKREEKILALLRDEQKRAKEKFPLSYAILATFGLVSTVTGFNKIIGEVDFLNDHPVALVVMGLAILLATGAAYKKLG